MTSNSPWSVKGINAETRSAVKAAAKGAGMTVGQWLTEAIVASASAQLRTTKAAPAEIEVEKPAMTGLPANMTEAIAELAYEVRSLREGGGGRPKDGGIAGPPGPYGVGGRPALAPLEDRISRLEAQISDLADAVEAAMLPPRHLEPWEKERQLGFGVLPDDDRDAAGDDRPLPEFIAEPVAIEEADEQIVTAEKERRLRGLLARFLNN